MNFAGFVGIDPAGLVGLAHCVDNYAHRLCLAMRNVAPTLEACEAQTEAELRATLASIADGLFERAVELRWRAEAVDRAQALSLVAVAPFPIGLMLAEFAAAVVFTTADWEGEVARWQERMTLEQLQTMEPGNVTAFFSEMTPTETESLARQHPVFIGSLDGAPPSIRYIANDILISREISRLEALVAEVRNSRLALLSSELLSARASFLVGELRQWLADDRQILLFDPAGDGRAVEVFGDIGVANRVAVVVPGMANDIINFGGADGGFRSDAAAIYELASDADVATVAWLGYDTPDGVDAVARRAAVVAAPDLARFLVGVDPDASRSITVVAHSYGSVVAGLASAGGIEADNLVFVGSPGTTLDTADDARLRPDGRIWSALAAGDPIGLGVDPFEALRWWHGRHSLLPLVAGYRTLKSQDELWHGTNPAAAEFGASQITTGGSHGHSEYFQATTLENLVLILEGRYAEVGLVD